MRRLILLVALLLTGCAGTGEQVVWPPAAGASRADAALYRIRIEQGGATRFSGLLALQPVPEGIRTVLLDATGAPLVKGLAWPDGSMEVAYAPEALRTRRIPELIGKLLKYIYFTSGNRECPWYILDRICIDEETPDVRVKQGFFGPVQLWQVRTDRPGTGKETIQVQRIPSLLITLERETGTPY